MQLHHAFYISEIKLRGTYRIVIRWTSADIIWSRCSALHELHFRLLSCVCNVHVMQHSGRVSQRCAILQRRNHPLSHIAAITLSHWQLLALTLLFHHLLGSIFTLDRLHFIPSIVQRICQIFIYQVKSMINVKLTLYTDSRELIIFINNNYTIRRCNRIIIEIVC